MRNDLYPNQIAQYILADKLREIEKLGISLERELNFGKKKPQVKHVPELPTVTIEDVPDVRPQLLTVRAFPNITTTQRSANGLPARESN